MATGTVRAQWINAKNFAQKNCLVLAVTESASWSWVSVGSTSVANVIVISAPSIATANVEQAIGIKNDVSAVVIALGLRIQKQPTLREWVRHVWIIG